MVGNELPCPRLVNARLHANVRITHVDPPLQAVGEEAAAARLDSHGGRSCVLRRAGGCMPNPALHKLNDWLAATGN